MLNKQPISRPSVAGKPVSLWVADCRPTDYPVCVGKVKVDVAIIGGGIVGLTTALLLNRSGATVAVLESGRIAQGVSGHTTAKVTSAHGLLYHTLLKNLGRERSRQYADANQTAVEFICAWVAEKGIACDLRRTFACTYTTEEKKLKQIHAEVEAAASLGLPVAFTETLPLPFAVKGAIQYRDQACFHPRKYLLAMAERINGPGSAIFENSRVLEVQEGTPCTLRTADAVIKADQVVVATHFPILNRGLMFAKMAPFRSYLMAVKTQQNPPEGMYINADEPVRTIRRHESDSGDVHLLVGGENHEVGHDPDTLQRYLSVEAFARRHFAVESVLYRWSTQDNRSVDQVPFIGRLGAGSRKIFTATGMRGWGMSNGTAAGLILADMIAGRRNRWQAVFDPARATPYISPGFFPRNAHVAKTFVTDLLARTEDRPASDLPPGSAGIAQTSGKMVAAFKDEQGGLHTVSPFCTHMGCRVSWNTAEQSWDCPCHGSRFDPDGRVLHAPAKKELKPTS